MSDIEMPDCIFCGGSTYMETPNPGVYIACNNLYCGAVGPDMPTEAEAIAAWMKHADEITRLRAVVAQIEQACNDAIGVKDKALHDARILRADNERLRDVYAVGAEWGDKEDDLSPAILAAHPATQKPGSDVRADAHKTFMRALELIGNRHSKYALVDLVNYLLTRNERLREAVTHAIATFDWYAGLHRAKGPEHQEKTKRNEDEAALLRSALAGEEPTHE